MKDIRANLAALSSKTFMSNFRSSMDLGPLLSGRYNSLPSLVMMRQILLLFEVGEKLKISRYRELNFLSTITVHFLSPPKLSLSPRKSCDKLIYESVDVEDDDSGGVLEGLLLLWMITSQSVCLVP